MRKLQALLVVFAFFVFCCVLVFCFCHISFVFITDYLFVGNGLSRSLIIYSTRKEEKSARLWQAGLKL